MDRAFDQDYLKNQQYRDEKNLSARIGLHRDFSENQADYFHWTIELVPLKCGKMILEVGCGTGQLWRAARELGAEMPRVVVSDLSFGMVAGTFRGIRSKWAWAANLDAQALPFPSETFDAVIANHMFYHVPDIPRTISEIKRVLKPDGILISTTNGDQHMLELGALVAEVKGDTVGESTRFSRRFSLESGRELLSRYFSRVETRVFPGGLRVTDASALIDYLISMDVMTAADVSLVEAFRRRIQREIDEKGYFYIQKSVGSLISRDW